MPLVYAAADLMMTRAGAATIAELATVGMPAVIVPWPGAAENHQVDNARELSDHHGGVLIEERDLTAERLISEIAEMMSNPTRLAEMSAAAAEIGSASSRRRAGRPDRAGGCAVTDMPAVIPSICPHRSGCTSSASAVQG